MALCFKIPGELITVDEYMERHGVTYLRAVHEINNLCNEASMRMTPEEQQVYAKSLQQSVTDDQIVAAYIQRRDWLQARAKEFADSMKPYQDQMATLEAEMHRRLLERNAKNSKTESGVAYIEETMSVKCEDKNVMLRFAIDNFDKWGKDLLTASVSKDTVSLYIEKTKDEQHPEGMVPPGLRVVFNYKVVFRKG